MRIYYYYNIYIYIKIVIKIFFEHDLLILYVIIFSLYMSLHNIVIKKKKKKCGAL